jgi:hypothetical protein
LKAPSPKIVRAARFLLETESAGLEALSPCVGGALFELREMMSTVVGTMGFRAVLLRARNLTQQRAAWWSEVRVDADRDTFVSSLEAVATREGADALHEGAVDLIAHVIALHCVFIGDNLTFRLLNRRWPDLPSEDGRAGPGES